MSLANVIHPIKGSCINYGELDLYESQVAHLNITTDRNLVRDDETRKLSANLFCSFGIKIAQSYFTYFAGIFYVL